MNTLEILTLARAKIADENNWCQGEFARNNVGKTTNAQSIDACSWCSLGAMKAVAIFTEFWLAETFMNNYTDGSVATYNDSHTHAEVLAAWDKAIAECAREGL